MSALSAGKQRISKESAHAEELKDNRNLSKIYLSTPVAAKQHKDVSRKPPQQLFHSSGSTSTMETLDRQDHSLRFRLLEVNKELSPSGNVVCILSQASLNTCGHYYSLSYTWADVQTTKIVIINGLEVRISVHLEAFLRRARKSLYNTPLWIDAICINQSSTRERNHQVAVMGQIYSRARKVLVWLGHGTDKFVYLLTRLSQVQASDEWLEEEETLSLLNTVANFLEHPYWSRAWIVQELLLARSIKLIYDEDTIEWDVFWEAVLKCVQYGKPRHPNLTNCIETTFAFQHYKQRAIFAMGQQLTLAEALVNYGSTGCADIRDRIFAMLSLVSNGSPFQANYDWSPAQVVLHTYSHFGGGGGHLQLLMQILNVSAHDMLNATPQGNFVLKINLSSASPVSLAQSFQHKLSIAAALEKTSSRSVRGLKLIQRQNRVGRPSSSRAISALQEPSSPKCKSCGHSFPINSNIFAYVFQFCIIKDKFHLVCVREREIDDQFGTLSMLLLLGPTGARVVNTPELRGFSIAGIQARIMTLLGLNSIQSKAQFIALPWDFVVRLSDDLADLRTFVYVLQETSRMIHMNYKASRLCDTRGSTVLWGVNLRDQIITWGIPPTLHIANREGETPISHRVWI